MKPIKTIAIMALLVVSVSSCRFFANMALNKITKEIYQEIDKMIALLEDNKVADFLEQSLDSETAAKIKKTGAFQIAVKKFEMTEKKKVLGQLKEARGQEPEVGDDKNEAAFSLKDRKKLKFKKEEGKWKLKLI